MNSARQSPHLHLTHALSTLAEASRGWWHPPQDIATHSVERHVDALSQMSDRMLRDFGAPERYRSEARSESARAALPGDYVGRDLT